LLLVRVTPYKSGFLKFGLPEFETGLVKTLQVTLTASEKIRFTRHPVHDPEEFDSLAALSERVTKNGYYGKRVVLP
jgi:hypothetical protein